MSDLEDEGGYQDINPYMIEGDNQGGHGQHDVDMENDNAELEPAPAPKRPRFEVDEEDEDEEEGDDDEDDDEDEEDEDVHRKGRKRQKRHKRSAVNRFIDLEAEVDEDEDEDEDEEEEYGRDTFIDTGAEGEEDFDANRRATRHARLDRRDREMDEQDLQKLAQDLSKRYGKSAVRYTGDMNEVPQRLLMPSVHDCSLWQVRVKPGRERDIVFSLMRKSIDFEYSANPLQILSAFQRDSLPGMIYVEARSSQQVSKACAGLVGVYPSRGIALVPIEEMASLLQIKKQDLTVTTGSWVRIRRGKYQGDLAQVMDITENGEDVGLKFIPRIDLNPKDDMGGIEAKKRKKTTGNTSVNLRPPQRFFNYEEIAKVYGPRSVSKRNQVYVFQNDTYKDGFIEKDFKLSGLILENVNPSLDEITRFTRGQDGTENDGMVDLSIIAEASRKAAVSVLQPGDHVEVFEGEQSGVHGVVQEISQDVVTISAIGVEMDGQKIDIPARSVRKRFKPGDHVKVMAGQNADETGLVVSVADNVVTFLSDMSLQEVLVFSKDLREAAEVGSSTNIVGNYELHDLVQLDSQTVGVIFKTERDSFRVLDQNGQTRLVQPHQISMRRDSHRSIATDSEGHEVRINDNMKEIDGEGRKGQVLHIHQSFFAFLHNRDIVENGGIFVTRARGLTSLAPKSGPIKQDLSKQNPAIGAPNGGMVGSGNMGRGPRDRVIGLTVSVVKGPYKGYVGTIKDTNGDIARVELRTGNKVVMIKKDKLVKKNPNGTLEPLEMAGGWRHQGGPPMSSAPARTPNPYANGRTPGWNAGRTPNPYANDTGRTPAWNASSRTPNPYAVDGGRTPAWNAGSKTPNPYANGGQTPAWNSSSRTPNPYAGGGAAASGWGGATPRPMGGMTPRPPPAWSGAADSWSAGNDSWQSDWNSAPTPAAFSAPTPGPGLGYPTPMPMTAPTPGPFATPAYYSAQTPGISAPTPGGGHDDYLYGNPDYIIPVDWLLDPHIRNKRPRVLVGNTLLPNYREGQYEYKSATAEIIDDSRVTLDTNIEPEAHLKFEGESDLIPFPVKYLSPVAPTRTSEKVFVLDGPRKNEVLSVAAVDIDSCVLQAPGGIMLDYPTGKLAVLAS